MTPWFLLMPAKRYRTELIVVGASLVVICLLPVMAVFGMTNVPALAKDDTLKLYTGTDKNENLYDYGYCTWWVSKRRSEVGAPIPQHWGDAHSWDNNALLAGYRVDHTPQQYAIVQSDAGALGHVMFVEEVRPNGDVLISEMNSVGWDIMNERVILASNVWQYSFIH